MCKASRNIPLTFSGYNMAQQFKVRIEEPHDVHEVVLAHAASRPLLAEVGARRRGGGEKVLLRVWQSKEGLPSRVGAL